MDTLKTAIVVVLLLAVLYGVYVTLNQPDQDVPEEIAWAQQQTAAPLQVDFGSTDSLAGGASASLADSAPWSSEQAANAMPDDHTAVAAEAAALSTPDQSYSPPLPPAPSQNAVAAPDLITSANNDAANYGAPSAPQQFAGGGAYEVPSSPTTTAPAPDASSAPYYQSGAEAGYAPAPSPDATALPTQPPTADATLPAQPSSVAAAPTGGYGDPGLAGNEQMIATAEPPVADSYAQPASTSSGAAATDLTRINSVIKTAEGQIEQGQHYEALLTLSFAYNAPGISAEETQMLERWLDPLAGKVIYSNEHLIGAPYQLQAGETLQTVATKHSVPWQLLANINGVRDPAAVQPGTSIKVVPGPFHADVDVKNQSLTLFAGRLYAGRFAITVNPNNAPTPGEYKVNDKQPGHSFYAGNAQTLSPQDPQNPFGNVWIDLGGNVSIHGTSSSPGQSERHGCIRLAAKDANDLYGILSLGSNVLVR